MSFAKCSLVLLAIFCVQKAYCMRCYECNQASGSCNDVRVCDYGYFGCFKTTTYTGGVDASGMQSYDPYNQVLTIKGCVALPIAGAEGCKQAPILGSIRTVNCYCQTDLCNLAVSQSPVIGLLIATLLIVLITTMYNVPY